MQEYILLFISIVLVNNFILAKFLGLCPFIGVSKQRKAAIGMGGAVIFVMTMASVVSWVVYRYLLAPTDSNLFYMMMGQGKVPADFDFTFLTTVVFILVIATLVQLVEMFLMKVVPPLYDALGIYLPLITTNCAVMGVALLNIKDFGMLQNAGVSLVKTALQGFGGGVGFMLVIFLMSGIRERLDQIEVPDALKGAPIAFICAGLMALAFMGFAGLGQ
ncbi:MAG: electron transport complex subunit RsxA [Deltaproteobacteria bacterium]|jgi:Na+-translocating ferredoxin:NAD+ oxidoreductase subunit A|nr:electron transport complex subunit RsxA [Deltaproteobacteria bacterium]